MEKNKTQNSAQAVDVAFPIRRSWIMSVLLIIPAVALFGAWDTFFNDKQLLPYLRFDSLFLPLYLLVFELPHIIASFLGFFQSQYVAHYKKHLFGGLPLVIIIALAVLFINFELGLVLYLVATLYHVVRQQTGVALFMGAPKNNLHAWWTWSLIVGLASMYIIMQPSLLLPDYRPLLMYGGHIALALTVILGLLFAFNAKTNIGFWYVLATVAMTIVSYVMLVAGYEFLSVLVVRVIHDVTAFLFYITHEMNNNYHSVKNWLYRFVPLLPWSLILIVPLVAIGGGLVLRTTIEDPKILFSIIVALSFAHYYLESIVWKRDGLHREQVRVI